MLSVRKREERYQQYENVFDKNTIFIGLLKYFFSCFNKTNKDFVLSNTSLYYTVLHNIYTVPLCTAQYYFVHLCATQYYFVHTAHSHDLKSFELYLRSQPKPAQPESNNELLKRQSFKHDFPLLQNVRFGHCSVNLRT